MSFTESVDELVAANESGLLAAHPTWARVRVADICSILNGFPFSSKQFKPTGGTPLIRIRDVVRGWSETHFVGDFDPTYVVRHGELVIGMDGDFNCALWAGGDALLNQRVCKLTPNERHYDLRLLAHALPGYLSAINSKTSAITVKHLSSKTVAEIPLPLPPCQEQARLVEAIESYFTRLDDAVATLERVQRNLKRYRASVLKAAVEGRLVPTEAELARAEGRAYESASVLLERILAERRRRWEEAELAKMQAKGKTPEEDKWKGKYKEPVAPDTEGLPELPEGWCWTTAEALSDEVRSITYGVVKLGPVIPGGVPTLRSSNVRHLRLDLDYVKPISKDVSDGYQRTVLHGDEVLVTVRGTLGGVAATPTTCVGFNISREVAMIALVEPCLTSLVATFIASDTLQNWIMRRTRGIAYTGINIGTLKHLPIPIPPLGEQCRIVDAVEQYLSIAGAIEATAVADVRRCLSLRQSILKWAFEGRLVDQDPTDEPASRFLERIQAERESANGNPRPSPRLPRARSPKA